MAYFAKLDENNIVLGVHCVNNDIITVDGVELEQAGIDFLTDLYGHNKWKKTSYNASTNSFRKNYAGTDFKYDEYWDAFIPPQPFPSWHLDYKTFRWMPPVAKPECGSDFDWKWGEVNKEWIRVDLNY
jgi:hypothetical protein